MALRPVRRARATDILRPLDEAAEEWDELARSLEAPPFLRPGWIRAWQSSFGRGVPLVFALRRHGRLAGFVPLERHRGSLRSPTNAHSPVFDVLAVDDDAARSLARDVLAAGARTLTLEALPAGGAGIEAFRAEAAEAEYRTALVSVARSPYIPCGPSLAGHERSLSRNLRHDVQRRFRRLAEAGAVSVQVAEGVEALDKLLDEGLAVERSGWKGDRGTAIASAAETARFYRDVAGWAAPEDLLRLAFLRLDGRAIAFQLDLEEGRTYYSLKIGFDPAYAHFAPGKLLAYTMLARAVSRGLTSYELLGTDEPWKDRWTDRSRERVTVRAFAPSAAGRASWSAFAYARPLARRVPLARRAVARLRRCAS